MTQYNLHWTKNEVGQKVDWIGQSCGCCFSSSYTDINRAYRELASRIYLWSKCEGSVVEVEE
jgi:hypothetical protein